MRSYNRKASLLRKPFVYTSLAGILAIFGLTFGIPALMDGWSLSSLMASTGDVVEPPSGFGLSTEGMVKAALGVAGAALVFVLIYLFDISSYASKISGKKDLASFNVNAWMLLIFLIVGMGFAIWELIYHGKFYYEVTSEHGVEEKSMFMITFILTGIVFVVTQVLLFGYSYFYRYREDRKATYYAHNNTLEIVWTAIPAVVLTILVLRGFVAFSNFTEAPGDDVEEIEVYAFQFGWAARYPGEDKTLGKTSFNYISASNKLGLAVESEVDKLVAKLNSRLKTLADDVANLENGTTLAEVKAELALLDEDVSPDDFKRVQKALDDIISGEALSEVESEIKRKENQLQRIAAMGNNYGEEVNDDKIVGEIHLAKDSSITMKFRAQDVIHSAYLPTFRMQMNCVPGMPTQFTFKPTVSTAEMRAKKNDENFDYYLYCAKICGTGHYGMKIKVVVESQAEVDAWLNDQSTFVKTEVKEEVEEESEEENEETATEEVAAL
jgi:cytochrome c oxidase subunit 2